MDADGKEGSRAVVWVDGLQRFSKRHCCVQNSVEIDVSHPGVEPVKCPRMQLSLAGLRLGRPQHGCSDWALGERTEVEVGNLGNGGEVGVDRL